MLGRYVTSDFQALLFQIKDMTPRIEDIISILLTEGTLSILAQSFGLESMDSCIQNVWTGVSDNKPIPATGSAEYENGSVLSKICFERSLIDQNSIIKLLKALYCSALVGTT